MCLYPIQMKNKKYQPTQKNRVDYIDENTGEVVEGHIIPNLPKNRDGKRGNDTRVQYVQIPCGNCIECRKQRSNDWRIRMYEEIKVHKYKYFITLTFSPEELKKLCEETGKEECNAIAGIAVRRMLERWRKDHKKSIKHWLITELGHQGTERIHLHGLLLNNEPLEFTQEKQSQYYNWKYWKYGLIYVGKYVNMKTITYISKYITKIDTDHKGFKGEIFCSPGIGRNYSESPYFNSYAYIRSKSRTDYYCENGQRIKLPTYWKNKAYNEEERELIWRDFMDKERISIMGNEYDLKKTSPAQLIAIRERAKQTNRQLGYGDNTQEWRKKPYNITSRMLKEEQKISAKIGNCEKM